MTRCMTRINEVGIMFRKQFGTMLLMPSVLVLAGCGSGPSINGNWTAVLTPSFAEIAGFQVMLTQGRGSTLNVIILGFTQVASCIAQTYPETSQETNFFASGTINETSGAFQMTLQSPPAVGDITLTLNGTLKNNVITGTWIQIGTGMDCGGILSPLGPPTGEGNFTMKKT